MDNTIDEGADDELAQYIRDLSYITIRNLTLKTLNSTSLSEEEAYFNLATLPTKFVKYVCDCQNEDIWKHIAIPEEKIPLAYMTIKAIVERQPSNVAAAINFVGHVSHPLLSVIKDKMIDTNEDKAAKFLAVNGVDIALPVFSELYNRNISLDDLCNSIYDFYFRELGFKPRQKHLEELDSQIQLHLFKASANDMAKDGINQAAEAAKKLSGQAKGLFRSIFD
jgi:hypothetical protein